MTLPRLLKTLLVAVLCFLLAAPAFAQQREPGTLLFLTDFGVKDGAVAVCKGVMLGIEPRLRIVDITHETPAYDIETAGEVIEQTLPFYPAGTVVVAVVDPGVGSTRKAMAALTKKGHLLVGPDNGIFTLALATEGLERAVELTNARFQRPGDKSYTFHGRDIFSAVGAHLAAGTPIDSLGPALVPIRLDIGPPRLSGGTITGMVRYIEDPYGNVVTNIPAAMLDSVAHLGDTLDVRIGARTFRLPWKHTFSDVSAGSPLAVMQSRGVLSFSINQGDFAKRYGVKRHDAVSVRRVAARRNSGDTQ